MNAAEINQSQMIEIANLRFANAELRAALNTYDEKIVAAVADEREACIKTLEQLPTASNDEFYTLRAAIAVIRARNGSK